MIDDIEIAGISEVLKEKMIEKLGYDTVLNMACNYERVKDNIHLLQSIGITDIEQLLLNKNYIFLKKPDDILKKLSNFNISNLVSLINEDYNVIDELFI